MMAPRTPRSPSGAAEAPRHARYLGGDGQPLLLIHAAFGTWQLWQPLLPELERRFAVLAPTLPGHVGGEPMPAGTAASTEALADGLERQLDAAGWDRAHVAGCSLGGLLALELAQRGRAHSVVALAPAGDPRRAGRLAARQIEVLFMVNRAVGRRLLSHARRLCASARGRRLLFWQVCAHPEHVDPTTAANYFHAVMACPTYRELLHNAARQPPRPLHQIDCPVLLAWPQKDRLFPYERYGRPLRKALPFAELRMLDDVGHLPMLDDPARIAGLIREFVEHASYEAAVPVMRPSLCRRSTAGIGHPETHGPRPAHLDAEHAVAPAPYPGVETEASDTPSTPARN